MMERPLFPRNLNEDEADMDHPYTIRWNDDQMNINDQEAHVLVSLGVIEYCGGCQFFHPARMRGRQFKFSFVKECVDDVRKLHNFYCAPVIKQ